jgi:hypothetical protein
MDPYLERHWGDVHHMLIAYARDSIRPRLPKDLRARVEERVTIEPWAEEPGFSVPDLRVLERPRTKRAPQALVAGPAVTEPLIVAFDYEITEGFIRILDASSGHRLITVIEVLSPTNKLSGKGQADYLKKREELRKAEVNLVEIDLTRAGRRLLPVSWDRLPDSVQTTYLVWVWRSCNTGHLEIYPMPLEARLPVLGIPLRQTDPDAPLDLQVLIDACYENGGYDDDLNYEDEPKPPLSAEEARWADALLRQAGRRSRSRRAARPNGRRKKA